MGKMVVGLIAVILVGCTDNAVAPDTAAPARATVVQEVKPPEVQQWLAFAQDESKSKDVRLLNARTIIRLHPGTAEATVARSVLDQLGEPVALPKWHYVTHTDQLSGEKGKTASLTSENALEFGFPYSGAQHGMLMIRHDKQLGNEVIVAIERGQVLCQSYSTCSVRIAFDDGKPRTLRGNDAADGSSTMVFLPGYASLTRQIAKAKKMRVQFDVYQQGSPVLVFDVAGFDPDKLR